jgi:tetratricopeptide (TPR) repeat protein
LNAFFLCVAVLPAQSRVEDLQRAATLIQRHELVAAGAILDRLLKQTPNDALALNLRGLVRVQQQRPYDAEQLFRQSISADPRIAGPHVNLALLYGVPRPLDAIAELKQALQLAPENFQAKSVLRTIARQSSLDAIRTGDKEKALAILLRASEALPHDPELLYELGFVALDSGLYPDAEISLQEVLRIKPDYEDAVYALARAYLGENKATLAEQQMRKYVAAKPNDAAGQYGLGYILMAEQKEDEARAAFERSVSLQPDQTESIFQLGLIAAQRGDDDSAREEFGKVLLRDPQHAGALTELGIFAYRSAKYEEAKSDFERAITRAPSYQKAHYYYALTLTKLGDKTHADHEFDISKSLQKTHTTNPRLALTQP